MNNEHLHNVRRTAERLKSQIEEYGSPRPENILDSMQHILDELYRAGIKRTEDDHP